jgi:hypothetical protein
MLSRAVVMPEGQAGTMELSLGIDQETGKNVAWSEWIRVPVISCDIVGICKLYRFVRRGSTRRIDCLAHPCPTTVL